MLKFSPDEIRDVKFSPNNFIYISQIETKFMEIFRNFSQIQNVLLMALGKM